MHTSCFNRHSNRHSKEGFLQSSCRLRRYITGAHIRQGHSILPGTYFKAEIISLYNFLVSRSPESQFLWPIHLFLRQSKNVRGLFLEHSIHFFCASELYHEVAHFNLVYSKGKKIVNVSVVCKKSQEQRNRQVQATADFHLSLLNFLICDSSLSFTLLKCI